MADWHGLRSDIEWVHRRVSWETWQEAEDYDNINGGSCEKSAFSNLKVSGTLSFDDGNPPDEIDPVRIYYRFTDVSGEQVTEPIATLLVENSSPKFMSVEGGGTRQSGSLKTYSVLKALSGKKCRKMIVIPAGTNAVAKAREICEEAGLRVNSASSSYVTATDKVFEPDDTHLTIVNDLMDSAGFNSVYPDAYGIVQMTPYVEPTNRPAMWTFRNDGESIMYLGVEEENDWHDKPNVYTVVYESETEKLSATARNVDTRSRASLPSRGWRENGEIETVDEIEGNTVEDRLANLEALAAKRIRANSSEVEYVKFSHFYIPISLNDSVSIEYSDKTWNGTVTDLRTSEDAAGTTDIEIRRFISVDLQIEVESEIVYQGEVTE